MSPVTRATPRSLGSRPLGWAASSAYQDLYKESSDGHPQGAAARRCAPRGVVRAFKISMARIVIAHAVSVKPRFMEA